METGSSPAKSCCGGRGKHASNAGTIIPVMVESVPTSIDPICKMTVKVTEKAHQLSYKGTTYYFCCAGCRRKFNLAPERYLSGAPRKKAAPKKDAIYICPMHPEVQSPKPGDCPDCGMPLESTAATATVDDTEEKETSQRLRLSALFTAPLVLLAMSSMFGMSTAPMHGASHLVSCWLQLALATPVVAWAAQPFFKRGWNSVVSRNFNMFTLLSLGIAIPYIYSLLSLLAVTISPAAGASDHMVYFESAGVITTLAWLGQMLELRARTRSTSAVRELVSLLPTTALVLLADGSEETVPVADLVDHCRVRIRPGERIPVDGVIIDGESLIDESALTGESLPVNRFGGQEVKAGTLNQTGSFVMETKEVGDDTMLAKIVGLVSEAQRTRVPIQQLADKVSAVFVPLVAVVALATFAYWMTVGAGIVTAITFATAVFVIACPCALGLATPMSIVVALGRAAQTGVLFRNAPAAQTLSSVDTIVLDKTGTLTEGKPVLSKIAIIGDTIDERGLLALSASIAAVSEHPLSRAIVTAAKERGISPTDVSNFQAQPGGGMQGFVDGKQVAVGNSRFMTASGVVTAVQSQDTLSFVAVDGVCIGSLEFTDTLKSNARQVVQALQQSGLRVILATGDNAAAAHRVADALGITEVHAQQTPADKSLLVSQLKQAGRKVAMVGDGINDSPALANADVGVAMSDGTDIAINAADVILLHGNLQGLVKGREVSRAMVGNIKQNLALAFAYNAISVPLAAGLLVPIAGVVLNPMVAAFAMSLSSVAVISNALRLRRLSV